MQKACGDRNSTKGVLFLQAKEKACSNTGLVFEQALILIGD
jgi:hypothetical protein